METESRVESGRATGPVPPLSRAGENPKGFTPQQVRGWSLAAAFRRPASTAMPRKSRRTVQRADPALDRRTWRPPTGRVARAATASEAEGEASAAARKTPKKGKEPKIGLLQLLHFATPLDYLCLSIAVPCAAGTGFLQVTRTTPPPLAWRPPASGRKHAGKP